MRQGASRGIATAVRLTGRDMVPLIVFWMKLNSPTMGRMRACPAVASKIINVKPDSVAAWEAMAS
jgi:hypothetical protein